MRKLLYTVLIVLAFVSCEGEEPKTERLTTEDGETIEF